MAFSPVIARGAILAFEDSNNRTARQVNSFRQRFSTIPFQSLSIAQLER